MNLYFYYILNGTAFSQWVSLPRLSSQTTDRLSWKDNTFTKYHSKTGCGERVEQTRAVREATGRKLFDRPVSVPYKVHLRSTFTEATRHKLKETYKSDMLRVIVSEFSVADHSMYNVCRGITSGAAAAPSRRPSSILLLSSAANRFLDIQK